MQATCGLLGSGTLCVQAQVLDYFNSMPTPLLQQPYRVGINTKLSALRSTSFSTSLHLPHLGSLRSHSLWGSFSGRSFGVRGIRSLISPIWRLVSNVGGGSRVHAALEGRSLKCEGRLRVDPTWLAKQPIATSAIEQRRTTPQPQLGTPS